jgi:hypothetical protein
MEFNTSTEKSTTYYKQDELIVILRGHIRTSMDNDDLYDFLQELSKMYELRIYLHTWKQKSSPMSWRKYIQDDTLITEEMIIVYFRDLAQFILSIQIDDDRQITLTGNTHGTIFSCNSPRLAWKNMWYGINCVMSKVFIEEDEQTIIFNTRYDLFANSSEVTPTTVYENLKNYFTFKKFKKNHFCKSVDNLIGVDNNIIGDKNVMYILVNHFHKNLDDIEPNYVKIYNHECVVFYENNRIFGTPFTQMFENIENYTIKTLDYAGSQKQILRRIWKIFKY